MLLLSHRQDKQEAGTVGVGSVEPDFALQAFGDDAADVEAQTTTFLAQSALSQP